MKTLQEIYKAEKRLSDWQSSLDDKSELLFIGVIAALGVPDSIMRAVAVCAAVWLWVRAMEGTIAKSKVEGALRLQDLAPTDYVGDPLNHAEVQRLKQKYLTFSSTMRRSPRYWFSWFFMTAALGWSMWHIGQSYQFRDSPNPLLEQTGFRAAVSANAQVAPGKPGARDQR